MRAAVPKLFKVGGQQWIALDAIESVDDFGWNIDVTLKTGRQIRVSGNDRDAFLGLVEKLSR